MSAASLYYGQPINWAHPLNRGLVSRWKVVPWYASGPRWIDLAGLTIKNHGTLATSGVVWQGDLPRPGGFGHLEFDGVAGQVTVAAQSGSVFTIAAWVRPDQYTTYHTVYADANQGLWLHANKIDYFQLGDHASTTDLVLGAWNHITVTSDGTTVSFYLNGIADGTSAFTANLPTAASLGIGGHGSEFFDGSIDDVTLWLRCLAATDVWGWYQATRQRQDPTMGWLDANYRGFTVAAGAAFFGYRALTGVGL